MVSCKRNTSWYSRANEEKHKSHLDITSHRHPHLNAGKKLVAEKRHSRVTTGLSGCYYFRLMSNFKKKI